jgi:D-glutamate cyclase
MAEMLAEYAEYIDRLITVEMRNRGMPHGKIVPLYEAARDEGGGRPLTLRAAEGLREHVRHGDTIIIVTGAGAPPLLPKGENDGPVGAAVLAHAARWGLAATPVFVCERHHVDPVVASADAAGITIRDYADASRYGVGGAIEAAPVDDASIAGWSEELLDRLRPRAIIAIERLGPNAAGVIHGATGLSGFSPQVDLSPLFSAAARRGIFSIGIGDAGNEIGFGRITAAVREIQPYGKMCRCPCEGGMATVVTTDVLVVAAVSNWGAYGIEAALSLVLGRVDLPHSPAVARQVISRCLEAGGLESMHGSSRFFVDGIAGESSVSLVQLLGEMVRIGLEEPDAGPVH